MTYTYTPKGVCSREFTIEINDGIVTNIVINGGCAGNTAGVATLCKGRSPQEIIELLDGIQCGAKATSCPDQLAQALKQALNQ